MEAHGRIQSTSLGSKTLRFHFWVHWLYTVTSSKVFDLFAVSVCSSETEGRKTSLSLKSSEY
jgi:hypothetical protein